MRASTRELVKRVMSNIRRENPNAVLRCVCIVTGAEDLARLVEKYVGARPRGFVKIEIEVPTNDGVVVRTLHVPIKSWVCHLHGGGGHGVHNELELIRASPTGRLETLGECEIETTTDGWW